MVTKLRTCRSKVAALLIVLMVLTAPTYVSAGRQILVRQIRRSGITARLRT